MNLALTPELEKLIGDRVRSGAYASPEDVIAAAVVSLAQQEQFGEFATGELDELLAEGERSNEQHGTLDGEDAHRLRRARRARANGNG